MWLVGGAAPPRLLMARRGPLAHVLATLLVMVLMELGLGEMVELLGLGWSNFWMMVSTVAKTSCTLRTHSSPFSQNLSCLAAYQQARTQLSCAMALIFLKLAGVRSS